MSFKFYCPEKFQKLAQWFVQKLRKTLLGYKIIWFQNDESESQ